MKRLGLKENSCRKLSRFTLAFILCLLMAAGNVSAQRLTLSFRNVPLRTVLKAVEDQTDYSFVYSSSTVDVERNVSVNVRDGELTTTLDNLFRGRGISYRINNSQIVLSAQSPAVQSPQANNQRTSQPGVVTGTLRDEYNEPMTGVVVKVKGTNNAVITDTKGEFTLTRVPEGAELEVSYMGYKTMVIPVGAQTNFAMSLEPETQTIENVVVTGFASIPKERAAASYNILSSEDVEQRRVSDLSSALVGLTPGMKGTYNADGTVEYTIRGISTLNSVRAPLVVVDGFPVENGFTDINPNDVQNITILKDAAAASIWGARAGNGVIVVTTKKGGSTFNVSFNSMFRIGARDDVRHVLNMATSAETVQYERTAWEKGWISSSRYTGSFSNDLKAPLSLVTQAIYKHEAGNMTDAELNAELARLSGIDNTGQIKDLLLANPMLQQYNLSVSGSSGRMRNFLSLMYEHETGKVIRNSNDRFRIRHNTSIKVFKWLDFELTTNIHRNRANTSGPTIGEMRGFSPYEMILDANGEYVDQNRLNPEMRATIPDDQLPYSDWSYNVLREARARNLTNEQLNTRVQAGLNFKIIEGLNVDTKFQYEYYKGNTNNYYSPDSYFNRDLVNTFIDYDQTTRTTAYRFLPTGGILNRTNNVYENWNWRNQVNFSRSFASKHHVTALAGMEIMDNVYNIVAEPTIYGHDPAKNTSAYPPYGNVSLSGKTQIKNITGSNITSITDGTSLNALYRYLPGFDYRNDRYVSAYGNASYSFDDKYVVQGSIRFDASNIISDNPEYRWAPMWSVGGMWHMHREAFMQDIASVVDRMSLRLTYGINGNVDKTTSHKVLLSMGNSPSATYGNLYTGSIYSYGNPNLGWEKVRTFNVGVDFSLLGNMITGSIDVYDKKSYDVIGNRALAAVLGTTSQRINNAEISNKGFEIELGYNGRITNEIGFGVNVNYAYNKNKITNLYFPSNYTYSVVEGAFVEGYPVNSVWAFDWAGMVDGMPSFRDNDGNIVPFSNVQPYNRGLARDNVIYMGPSDSPHDLGINLSFRGYGFTLSAQLLGEFGGFFRNPTFQYPQIGKSRNIYSQALKYTLDQIDGLPTWPKQDETTTYLWDRYTPYLNTMVESRSHIRFREINLSYDIPGNVVKKIGIANAQVYGQVLDLGCIWVKNSRGYDPYWLPGSMRPVTTYLIGIKLNF